MNIVHEMNCHLIQTHRFAWVHSYVYELERQRAPQQNISNTKPNWTENFQINQENAVCHITQGKAQNTWN